MLVTLLALDLDPAFFFRRNRTTSTSIDGPTALRESSVVDDICGKRSTKGS
jgi:hypothetical protein